MTTPQLDDDCAKLLQDVATELKYWQKRKRATARNSRPILAFSTTSIPRKWA